ncbi:unnamed protein product [Caenorhabditis auriculariae]|uniref:Major facilitator superfamily (MFS) profile domain-containing protein n=1 Tax=Caenorhabditis auriculariae TaxID=2777116 RepID=A0A8S1HDB4_9PELO|nr:unnamed protein product [Caenorhabditis auriculariae]
MSRSGSSSRLPTSSQRSAAEVPGSSWPNPTLSLVALVVSLGGGFNFCYQLLITNSSEEAFLRFTAASHRRLHGSSVVFSDEEIHNLWGIILAILFWGSTVGAFFIQVIGEKLGRKNGIIFSFLLEIAAIVATLISWWIENYILYAAARFVLGGAISISVGIAPMFITECSPASCRGIISLATAIMMQIALVVGAVVAMPEVWGLEKDWWRMYALELLILIPVTIATCFFRESPSFLTSRGKNEEAMKSIEFYHGVQREEASKLLEENHEATKDETKEPLGLFGIFGDAPARRGMLLGNVIMFGMCMCGIIAINAFAYKLLLRVGFAPLEASIGNAVICAMTVLGVLLSSLFIERYGRRSLLLVTFTSLAVINVIIYACMLIFEHNQSKALGWAVVISICIFNVIFSTGPAPISFFITGELVSQPGRAAACTWVIVMLNASRSIVLAIYNPLEKLVGGPSSYFLLFFPPCVLVVVILYYYLPETRGKSPEEAAEDTAYLPKLCGQRETSEEDSA